jgi:hypothetical protein
LRRITLAELVDRARQAALSRAEGVRSLQRWVLPRRTGGLTREADCSAAFARLAEILPTGDGATGSSPHPCLGLRPPEGLCRSAEAAREGRFDLMGMQGLSFGRPVDWHLDPAGDRKIPLLPWKRLDSLDNALTGDRKVVWELNRHQHLLQCARAYAYSGDLRHAEVVVEHIASWIRANPPALGINWVSSVDIAFRCISWLWAIALLQRYGARNRLPLAEIAASLHLQGCHIETYLSTYFSPNTHLTGEALGLYYLGTCLPQLERAGRWRALGRGILLEQLDRQVHADGVYFEQSTWYHRYTAEFYLHFVVLAERAGEPLPAHVRERLAALLDHLMWITRPDGTSPYIGDDDGGRLVRLEERAADDWRGILCSGAVMFGRSDYKHVAGDFAEQACWLLGPDAKAAYEAIRAQPPDMRSRAFHDGGYYVMRSGWHGHDHFLLVDCGPHGAMNCGHAHGDALAIEVAAQGTTMLVDAGTFTYTGSAEARDLFRSTAMHNTLTIDGLSSSHPAGPFKWKHVAHGTLHCWHDHPDFTYFSGSHDGYRRLRNPATHRRDLWFVNREYWLMLDRVDATGDHELALHFHLAPDVDAALHHESGWLEARAAAATLDITCTGAPGCWSVADGLVSPCYGATVAAAHAAYSLHATGPAALLSVLFPRPAGEAAARIRTLDCAHGKALAITTTGFRDLALWSAHAAISEGLHAIDFEWAWVRRRAGDRGFDRALLLHGASLASDEMEVMMGEPVEFAALWKRDATLWVDLVPCVALRIRPPAGVQRVVVNGRMHAARAGTVVNVVKDELPPLAARRDADGRCSHVRH